MYAIVEIAGKQYKVRENDKLIVPRLSGEVDDTVTFDRVLLYADDDETFQLGTPVIPDAAVTATIVEHVKGDKVLVFRKKRRKRFKVKRGHRQPYTRIEVSGLSFNGRSKTESDEPAEEQGSVSAEAQSDVAAQAQNDASAQVEGSEEDTSSASPVSEKPTRKPTGPASKKAEPKSGESDANDDDAVS
jgi:large subunit ribosomal protein L21